MVSIIVPVYNIERYLPQCMNSLFAQTAPDFEVILVDDGSTDGSAALCDSMRSRTHGYRSYTRKTAACRRHGMPVWTPRRDRIFCFWMETIISRQARYRVCWKLLPQMPILILFSSNTPRRTAAGRQTPHRQ